VHTKVLELALEDNDTRVYATEVYLSTKLVYLSIDDFTIALQSLARHELQSVGLLK
jgi:hypothetical protein